jgi:glycosyl transferase family 25
LASLAIPFLYVINLDTAKDRWDIFARAHEAARDHIVRVSAVAGAALSLSDYERLAGKWPCFFYHGRFLTKAEIGCCLSHIRTMERFLASGDEIAVIAEDDIKIDLLRLEQCVAHIAAMPADWEMIKLSYMRRLGRVKVASLMPGMDGVTFFDAATGTGAYIINRSGAKRLTETLSSFGGPIDHCFDRTWQTGIHSYGVWPAIAAHRPEFESDIDNPSRGGDVPRNQSNWRWRLWSVTVRPVSVIHYARRKYRHVRSYCGRPPSLLLRLRRWGIPI